MSTTFTNHEPTAWMRTAIAATLRRIDSLDVETDAVIVAPMGRTTGRDDRTCDRCRHYVPIGPPFYVDMIVPRPGVHIVVGLCQVCRDLERGGR